MVGFGKSEVRFAKKGHQEAHGIKQPPGPGAYFTGEQLIKRPNNESYSKKGYGNGFISKLKRFREGKEYGYFLQIPGPGAYQTAGNL